MKALFARLTTFRLAPGPIDFGATLPLFCGGMLSQEWLAPHLIPLSVQYPNARRGWMV